MQTRVNQHLVDVRECREYVTDLRAILAPYQSGALRNADAITLHTRLNNIVTGFTHLTIDELCSELETHCGTQLEDFVKAYGLKSSLGASNICDQFQLLLSDTRKASVDQHLKQYKQIKTLLHQHAANEEFKVLHDKFAALDDAKDSTPAGVMAKFKVELDSKDTGPAMNALLEKHASDVDSDTDSTFLIDKFAAILPVDRERDYIAVGLKALVPYLDDKKYEPFAELLSTKLKAFQGATLSPSESALSKLRTKLQEEIEKDPAAAAAARHFFSKYVYKDPALVRTLLPFLPIGLKNDVCWLLKNTEKTSTELKAIQEGKADPVMAYLSRSRPEHAWRLGKEAMKVHIAREHKQEQKLTAVQSHYLHCATDGYYVTEMKALLGAPGLLDDKMVEQIIQYEQKRIDAAMDGATSDTHHFNTMNIDIEEKLDKELKQAQDDFQEQVNDVTGSESVVKNLHDACLAEIKACEDEHKEAHPTLYAMTNFPAVFTSARARLQDAYEAARDHCLVRDKTTFIFAGESRESALKRTERIFATANTALTKGFKTELTAVEKEFTAMQQQVNPHLSRALNDPSHKAHIMRLITQQRSTTPPTPPTDEDVNSLASSYVSKGMQPIKHFHAERAKNARYATTVAIGAATPTGKQADAMQLAAFLRTKAGCDANEKAAASVDEDSDVRTSYLKAQMTSALEKDKLVMRTSFFGSDRDWTEQKGTIGKTKTENPKMIVQWILDCKSMMKLDGKPIVFAVPAKLEFIIMGIMKAEGVPPEKYRIIILGKDEKADVKKAAILFQKGMDAYAEHIANGAGKAVEEAAAAGVGPVPFTKAEAMEHIDPTAVATFHTPGLGCGTAAPAA
ncbi:hypothetical protein BH10PSE19_BH10PSE19_17740 [soil metagenome]